MTDAPDPAALRRWLVRWLAERLEAAEEDIDQSEPLSALGLSSVAVAGLAEELREFLGRELDPSVVFEYPTVTDLVRHLSGAEPQRRPQPRAETGHQPVAIVGIACHVPGAGTLDELWSLLVEGKDAIGLVPAGRWNLDLDAVASSEREHAIRFGGFLADVDRFDAQFFHVTREEAVRMDPQQRLLLQTTWEALEDAGIPPSDLRGSRTGVFVGICANEYGRRQLDDIDDISALMPTGNALSTSANRISYLFDLRGPSLAVDTACSSSLVATHLAVRSLQRGEAAAAVVAGVNLLLEPEVSLALARAGILARDGRCRAFAAAADGYVRSEGCVAVVLKPLAAAQADGDRIYAVIRGSAVNQDGTSNGLTAPNPRAQVEVLADAYADAQLSPAEVGYVECHGSGTLLGDPIEARALGEVIGASRMAPCAIGSIKANIGHLEAAAGLAGLAKTALMLHRGVLPPAVHFAEPNPNIAFARLGLTVNTAATAWPQASRIAGVSSFGFGGTNAHVVVAAAAAAEPAPDTGAPLVLATSGRDQETAAERARQLARFLRTSELPLGAIAATTTHRREHHSFRLGVHGRSRDQLAARLEEAAERGAARARGDPELIFVYGGQGDLTRHAALLAHDTDRRFRVMLDRCDEIVRELEGWSVAELLAGPGPGQLALPERAQPTHVALQLALTARWEGAGIRPSAVVGHSIGEIAAAYVAGALSLEQALRVALARGHAVGPTIGSGRMLIVGCGEDEAAGLMTMAGVSTEISAVNSARSTVLSGSAADLDAIWAACERTGRFAAWVPVEYPSHSSAMDDAARTLTSMLAGLDAAPPSLPMWSTVTGQPLCDAPGAAYWGSNLRRPVRFAAAISGLLPGAAAVLEPSPQPSLRSPVRHLAVAAGRPDLPVIESVEPPASLDDQRAAGLAALYEQGATVRWEQVQPGQVPVTIPAYPWRQDRYWYDRPAVRASPGRRAALLGQEIDLVGDERRWQLDLGGGTGHELLEHSLGGTPVMPAAGFIELLLEAARALGLTAPVALRDIAFQALLPLAGSRRVQTVLRPHDAGFAAEVHSRQAAGQPWTQHLSALLVAAPAEAPHRQKDPAAKHDVMSWYGRCLEPLPVADLYLRLKETGLDYGPAFRRVTEIWRGDREAIGTVRGDDGGRYLCHPGALDGALQVAGAAVADPAQGIPIPVRISSLTWHGGWAGSARVLASAGPPGEHLVADVAVAEPDGRVLVEMSGFEAKTPGRPVATRSPPLVRSFEVSCQQQPSPAVAAPRPGRWLVIGDGPVAAAIVAAAPETVAVTRHREVPMTRPGALAAVTAVTAGSPADETPADVILVLTANGPRDSEGARDGDEADQATDAAMAALETARALSLTADPATTRLWIVTVRAQPLGPFDQAQTIPGGPSPTAAAAAWGLARVFSFETPELEIRCADLGDRADADGLAADIRSPTDESEIAWRDGRRWVRRLTPAAEPKPPAPGAQVVRPGAAYLITGGLGDLGLAVSQWLVGRGAGQVILMSRQPSAEAVAAAHRIGAGTCEISVVPGDVADSRDVARALATVGEGRRLAGLVHAAGVLSDAPLFQLDRAAFDRVGRARPAGLASLLSAAPWADLDWLVVFSSVAGVVGSPGQGAYCAAGAAMDALAARARQQGHPVLTVNWGPWGKVGLAARTASSQQWRTGTSFAAIEPEEGIRLLAEAIRGRWSGVAVPFDFADLVRYFPRRLGTPLFSRIAADTDQVTAAVLAPQTMRARPSLRTEFTAPRSEVERVIAAIWLRTLGYDRVGVTDGFFELGGDSVLANQVILEAGRSLGVIIEPAEAFAELTVARLAELAERAMVTLLDSMTEEEAQLRLSQWTHPEEETSD